MMMRRYSTTAPALTARLLRSFAWISLATLALACTSSTPPVQTGPQVKLNTSLPPIDVRYGIAESDIELGILLAIAHAPRAPALRPGQAITDDILPQVVGSSAPGPNRGSGWYFDGRRPGLIFAGYRQREVRMRVAIRFDKQLVMLRIIESENLGQTDDRIDAKAFTLLGDLDQRIRNSVIAVAQRNRYGTPLPAKQAR